MVFMGKDDMVIMALPVKTLFSLYPLFEGFQADDAFDFESHIIKHHLYGRRGDLEIDATHKHPIPYVLIVNSQKGLVYAYQRSSNKTEAHESRLHGKWSWGVGGHVEQVDGVDKNPIRFCLEREVDEEVQINGNISSISLLGYINNSDPVGLVHFGILYLLETDAVEVSPADKEMKQGKFMCLSELEEICVSPDCTVEAWSQIALDPLKRYFASLQH
ncbi:MAG: phosphoesterase [archaeon GW2011_AR17]|nr:MAG: phosphoesterase [archaeon GW2011_AR17]